MPDLDPAVGRLFHDVAHTDWPEPGEIRARGSRRTARRAAVVVSLTVTVVVALVLGVGTAVRRSGGVTPLDTATTTVSPPPSTPTSTPTADPSAGFAARDMSFVSQNIGWLLAVTPCAQGLCSTVVHTIDGGRTWASLPALPPDLPTDGTSIRFADTHIGYLFGPSVLYLTSDGGATWTRQPGGADALEVANGTVLRISSTTPGCPPGCTYQISRAPTGSTRWQTVLAAVGDGVGVQLLRSGHRAFAVVYRNLAGGASAHGILATSGDDGATWQTRPDPCGTSQGAESASERMAVADDGSMTMLCLVRGGPADGPSMVVTSSDGGGTFGPQRATPGSTLTVGAASATTLFVSALEGRAHRLYRSADGGATWAVVATGPDAVPDGAVPPTQIGFQNSQAGCWLPGYATVFTTADAGRSWTPHAVSGR